MYSKGQIDALTQWVGTKHDCIADYYDNTNNGVLSGKVNDELARRWLSAIEASPIYSGFVYRGLRANEYRPKQQLEYVRYVSNLHVGDLFRLTRPSSASVSRRIGKCWALPDCDNKPYDHHSVLLRCSVDSGRDIRSGPKHKSGDEEEIVLMHDLCLKVTRVSSVKEIQSSGEGRIQLRILWLRELAKR